MVLSYLWEHAWPFVYLTFLRPMLKWILRRVTGKCELIRLCYGEPQGCRRTKKIECSLRNSKIPTLKRMLTDNDVNVEESITEIMLIKSITPEVHPQFKPTLKVCLFQICGYRLLLVEVESIRKTKYNAESAEDEQLLMQLWEKLMPDTPLETRLSKQWGEIGFQGEDPQTDFRGMGMLGLHNLCFFANQYNSTARNMLSQAQHPQNGYSFAIVGINLTHLTYQLLISGALKTHFYNLVYGQPKMEHFHQVYCYLFYEFNKFWFEEKPNIMEFNRVRDKFEKKVRHQLKDKSCILHSSFMSSWSKKTEC